MRARNKFAIVVIGIIAFLFVGAGMYQSDEREVTATPKSIPEPQRDSEAAAQMINDVNALVKKAVDMCSEINSGGIFSSVDERVQCKKIGVDALRLCETVKNLGLKVDNCMTHREDLEFLAGL